MAQTAKTGSRLVIVTGGPGSGKSSLAAALADAGFRTMPEAGRGIIRDQIAIGGVALPWADRSAFADLMLSWDLRSYREAQAAAEMEIVFFRPWYPGRYRLSAAFWLASTAAGAARSRIFRYDRVFIALPWPEIFTQDPERRQTIEEAEATYHAVMEVYAGLGYELVTLPRLPVAERVAFVLSTCA